MQRSELIRVRTLAPGDRNFIMATWLRGLRYGNSWFGMIDQDTYFRVYGQFIEKILADPKTLVQVACLHDDPEVILGYAVSRGDSLDFVFVKRSWRKIGIAKSLTSNPISRVTHLTSVGASILRQHPNVKFDPFV